MDELVESWFVDHFHGSAIAQHTAHYNLVRGAVDALKPALAKVPEAPARAALIDRWFADHFPGSQVDTNAEHFELVRDAIADLKVRVAAPPAA
jgi:hypothetical protein